MEKVDVVWPSQSSTGTHINVSGGGMGETAPHKEAAAKFLEYLASDRAQRYFADGNNEWPAVENIQGPPIRRWRSLGKFKAIKLPVNNLAMYQAKPRLFWIAPDSNKPQLSSKLRPSPKLQLQLENSRRWPHNFLLPLT